MGEPQVSSNAGRVTALARARSIQARVAGETNVWMKLDLLEDLISEIEQLNHRVEALSENHMKPVRERALKRQEEADHDRGQAPLSRQQK